MRQQQYRIPALKQLSQQVRFTPVERRLEQLNRAEKLLMEIQPDKQYPYQYICFRITEFRPDSNPGLLLEGRDLEHDLARFIQELDDSVPAVPAETVSEPVLTLEEVSHHLKVSTKTVSRWRDRGLVSRRIIRNGRCKVGFRQSLLNRFLAQNQAKVEKSSRFSQLDEHEKADILRRARRMARYAPDRFTDICHRIAAKMGRSPETVRYTIKRHDQAEPGQAIFPHLHGPLDEAAKLAIYGSYRRGISIESLARRYHRTRSSVHRVINEVRARRLLEKALEYIPNPIFLEAVKNPATEADLLSPMPDLEEYVLRQQRTRGSAPKGVPPELAPLYDVPLLSREQEYHLFRQMNFLKFKANQLRARIDPARARSSDLDRLEELQRQANDVKDQLINANMRLVASIAKRHSGYGDNYFELMSDGNMSLIRAVEKFDYSRGNKFSTYASWAIMKNFARSVPDEQQQRNRFVTGHEDMFALTADNRSNEYEEEKSVQQRQQLANRLLDLLPDERERRIMRLRFGIDAERNLTLEEVGKREGITKERVRQIEARTMTKLKSLAKEQQVELP
jgi:RNA polymerase sigma factor (sigma-70 family)